MQEICLQHAAADGLSQVLPTTGGDLRQGRLLRTQPCPVNVCWVHDIVKRWFANQILLLDIMLLLSGCCEYHGGFTQPCVICTVNALSVFASA